MVCIAFKNNNGLWHEKYFHKALLLQEWVLIALGAWNFDKIEPLYSEVDGPTLFSNSFVNHYMLETLTCFEKICSRWASGDSLFLSAASNSNQNVSIHPGSWAGAGVKSQDNSSNAKLKRISWKRHYYCI